ncbi:uncharacterized protein [Henckelia pumila]|uniref:uncharacterized protein n=1 Tax=Henckelia pumila TaxID=405737 RepID=UPI003C6E4306
MNTDDSFKKPGAVPFKWEIRPGVPKFRNQQKQTQPVIRPPPARFYEPRGRVPGKPDIVSSGGCFPSPKRPVKKRNGNPRVDYVEPECSLDLETSSHWSFSSRRSPSPSLSSSPFGSSMPVSDAEWATFGLF